MGKLWEILSGPVSSLVDSVGAIIGDVHTSTEEEIRARAELLKVEREFHKAVLTAEASIVQEQSKIIQAETNSQSWLARNWRPLLMLVCILIVANNYLIMPLFGTPPTELPDRLWDLMTLGVTGYVLGRSAEKIVSSRVSAPTV
jgi:hypothetical protein